MSRLEKLPCILSRFLGYRNPSIKQEVLPLWRVCLWSFIAAWIGIALLEITFTYGPSFKEHNAPIIIASFGAGAVLVYGAIDAPLSQPRNVIGGQTIGSIVGVIIAQLFLGIKKDWESEGLKTVVMWLAGATAMATALVIMQITKTVHPPAGATALIATVTPSIIEIKWFYIGIVVLSAFLQVTIGCLINNIERKYPSYWWTPEKPPTQNAPNVSKDIVLIPNSTVCTLNIEEDHSEQKKQKESIQNTSPKFDLNYIISALKTRSTDILTRQENESLYYLLDKMANASHI